eukprot:13014851-Ditylum_brightwellii.AAC.1
MFVDDATLFYNLMKKFNVEASTVMKLVQYDVTLWGWYLWVAGGLLEYNTTQYCSKIWALTQYGKPVLLPETQLPTNNVIIQGAVRSNTLLRQFDVNKAVKMLGVRHAVNLKHKTKHNNLLGKMTKFACAIIACPSKPHQ